MYISEKWVEGIATNMSESRCGCVASISNVGDSDSDMGGEHQIPTVLGQSGGICKQNGLLCSIYGVVDDVWCFRM